MVEQRGYHTFTAIKDDIAEFFTEAEKFYMKGNKRAGRRARKALARVCKLKAQWRKETVR